MSFPRVVILLLAIAVAVQPSVAACQSADPEEAGAPKWRRWVGAAAGALLLGGAASLTDQAGEQARTGVCDTKGCVMAIGGLVGGGVGFLLGSEWDRRVDRRAREGPTLDLPMASVPLAESPTIMLGDDVGVLALTRDRVFVVDDSLRARPVLTGFPARASTVGMDGGLLLFASSTQIVGMPFPDVIEEPIPLAATGAAGMESLGDGAVAMSEPGRIRRMELSGSRLAPSLLEDETVATSGVAAALRLAPGGSLLWTLEDSSLVARRAATLQETARLALPGRAVQLALAGPTAAVAIGDQGAVLVDISDPAAPRITHHVSDVDFAYDAAVLDGRIYVAAGAQGVFVYELGQAGAPVKLGVVRTFDFAGDLLVRHGRLYILDRAAGILFRL